MIVFTTHAAETKVRDYFTRWRGSSRCASSVVVHVTGTLVLMFTPALLAPAAVAAGYREWRDAVGFL